MSVPSTSTTTQPPILVGDAGKSVLPAARVMTSPSVTLPLHHSTPLEPASSHETPVRFGTQRISPVSGQSPDPPVLSPQIPFSQLTLSRIPETLPDSHPTHRPVLSEVYTIIDFQMYMYVGVRMNALVLVGPSYLFTPTTVAGVRRLSTSVILSTFTSVYSILTCLFTYKYFCQIS